MLRHLEQAAAMEQEATVTAQQTPASPQDSGLECLVTLARLHNIAASAEQLRHEFGHGDSPFKAEQLLLAARRLGLRAKPIQARPERLTRTPLPAIAKDKDGHFFILARVDQGKALVQIPGEDRPQVVELDELYQRWSGRLILLRPDAPTDGELARFDFTWFIPAIVKHRKVLGEVLVASLFLQLFALITPLFFQVVMDKVLVHRGLSTLDVLMIGLLAIMLFETVLSGLRSYVFTHTASRIDVELGSRLYRHLLALPLAYFQARRMGDSVARVRELKNIRSFLTGNAITLVLDLLFCVLFIAVMLFYSGWLTLVVLLSLPLYLALTLFITPMLRALAGELQPRCREPGFPGGITVRHRYAEGAGGRAAIGPPLGQPAGRLRRRLFQNQFLSTLANEGVGLIGKLVTNDLPIEYRHDFNTTLLL
ncbi:ABC transporter transmembrane domain-containing protein [Stenotrophomonas humi]